MLEFVEHLIQSELGGITGRRVVGLKEHIEHVLPSLLQALHGQKRKEYTQPYLSDSHFKKTGSFSKYL